MPYHPAPLVPGFFFPQTLDTYPSLGYGCFTGEPDGELYAPSPRTRILTYALERGESTMLTKTQIIHLKWASRAVIVLSAFFSVWANVLHVENYSIPAYIFAAAPPIAVLLGFELISRIPARPGLAWYRRWPRPLAAAAITFLGAWLSYWHQKAAIFKYNSGDEANAAMLPLIIDGLMIVASVGLIELNHWARELDLKMAGVELAKTRAKATEVPKEKAPTQKERIATAMVEMPWATAKEIATKLGDVKETYAANIMSELRKAQRANGKAVPAHN